MRKKRIIPKITLTNFRKAIPGIASTNCFKQWFSINRYWGGSTIEIAIRHYGVCLDFRKNWLDDMKGGE
jgi:hypothetical protein